MDVAHAEASEAADPSSTDALPKSATAPENTAPSEPEQPAKPKEVHFYPPFSPS